MTQHFVMAADRIIGMRTGDPSTWPETFATPQHAGFGTNPDASGPGHDWRQNAAISADRRNTLVETGH
jgi:hypothetical protein